MSLLLFLSKFIWPLTIVLLVFVFKTEVAGLLNRLNLVQIGSARAEMAPLNQASNIVTEAIKEVTNISGAEASVFYESQERVMKQMKGKKDDKDLKNYCFDLFPIAVLNYIFLKIYLGIFGTQIELMHHLNSKDFANEQDLFDFYIKGKSQAPELYNLIGFDSYLSFLINNDLIAKGEDCHITALGRDFLKFLNSENLPPKLY